MEMQLISEYQTQNPTLGYNLTSGGDGGGRGHQQSDETRRKRSLALRGRPQSAELRRKRSLALMGNKSSLGRQHKPETIEKMRAARVAYWQRHR